MSAQNVFSLRGVGKVYRTDVLATCALQATDLDIAQGDFVAVMGPSGSGKTTLLTILGLLDGPTSGRLDFCGERVDDWSDSRRSRVRGERIGFVFQSFNLIPTLSVLENVELPLLYRGLPGSRELAQNALARMGLQGRMAHLPHQLSGGQKQRAAMARAIAGRPDVILADEPTGNLDTESARGVMELLVEINAEGTAVVMVTHDSGCSQFARRVVLIVDGVVHEAPAVRTPVASAVGEDACSAII